jgi:hypothetical protein
MAFFGIILVLTRVYYPPGKIGAVRLHKAMVRGRIILKKVRWRQYSEYKENQAYRFKGEIASNVSHP